MTEPEERERRMVHLAVAWERLVDRRPVKQLARDWDVSARSVKRWTRAALGYDGALADRLRAAAGAPARRVHPSGITVRNGGNRSCRANIVKG